MAKRTSDDVDTDLQPVLVLGPKLRLIIVGDDNAAFHLLHADRKYVLGRGIECEIAIRDGLLSRRHLVIEVGPPGSNPPAWVQDLGSRNGTRIAGKSLDPQRRVPFGPGVVVEAGTTRLLIGPAEGAGSDTGLPRTPDPVIADPAMAKIYELVGRVARSDISVLLTGETGAGKEVVAEMLHATSARHRGPFLRLNCSALPENLLESELFGYERGAFSGAEQAKTGLLEAASGGTVMLDELGEMSLGTQAKILRVIEDRKVRRLGGISDRPIDVRLVSATNRDLGAEVEASRFRRDLLYRLNGITIAIPPLRERVKEIAPLAHLFAARVGVTAGLDPEALAWLEKQPWPGNVRELKNAIERAAVFAAGARIGVEHLLAGEAPPARARVTSSAATEQTIVGDAAAPLADHLRAIERDRILAALDSCGGNQTRAAEKLGISRKMLLTRLDAYGITRPRKSR